jgi:hypothetical protein
MMIGKTVRLGMLASMMVVAGVAAGCGDGDTAGSGDSGSDGSDSSGTKSFSDISAKLAAPTGTVSATTAGGVAAEFEKTSSASLGGIRDDAGTRTLATQDMSSAMCVAGGTAQASGSGSASSGSVSVDLNDCCVAEACCYNGSEDIIYSDGSASAAYSICYDYAITGSCEAESISVNASGCVGSSGAMVYSVTVSGETFTVSGAYSAGSGTLTVTGVNGTWECTYSGGTGTCTGTGGDFTF